MMIVLIICVENHDDAIFDKVMTQGKSEDGAGKSSGGGEGGAKPSVFQVREIQRNMQKQTQIFQQIQRLQRNKDKGGSKLSFSKSISSMIWRCSLSTIAVVIINTHKLTFYRQTQRPTSPPWRG